MFAEILGQLAVVAAFVQKVIALVKPSYKDWEYQKYVDLGLSIGISAALCYAWGIDVFALAGIAFPAAAWLGAVLTGVVAGSGANVLNDILALLEIWKKQKKLDVVAKNADIAYWNAKVEEEKSERGS